MNTVTRQLTVSTTGLVVACFGSTLQISVPKPKCKDLLQVIATFHSLSDVLGVKA